MENKSDLTAHTACISFWIPKRQAFSTDNGFILKKINQNWNWNIKEKKKPGALSELHTCQLARPIHSKRLVRSGQQVTLKGLVGFFSLFYILIFIYFSKYETIVRRNGLSLGYSERDTSSVESVCHHRYSFHFLLFLFLFFSKSYKNK